MAHIEIGATGISMSITAKNSTGGGTYPFPQTLSTFSDDKEPISFEEIDIGDEVLDLNSNSASWSKAMVIPAAISTFPNSDTDTILNNIFQANRPSNGRKPAQDTINLVVNYPDRIVTLKNGKMIKSNPGYTVTSEGRKATKTYSFKFNDIDESLVLA